MSFSIAYPQTVVSGDHEAISNIILRSSGWSGVVVDASATDQADRTFNFAINYHVTNNGVDATLTSAAAHVNRGSGIVGISLEHMGAIVITAGENVINQCLGMVLNSAGTGADLDFAWGTNTSGATDIDRDARAIFVDTANYTRAGVDGTLTNTNLYNLNIPNMGGAGNPLHQTLTPAYSAWYRFTASTVIDTDLPIFSTDAELLAYCASGGTVTTGMLNLSDPYEDYTDSEQYYHIYTYYSRNSRRGPTNYINYRFKPASGKICLYTKSPTASDMSDYVLYGYSSYNITSAFGVNPDDDEYSAIDSGSIQTKFLSVSAQFGNDYTTVYQFDHDLPIFGSLADAQRYENDELDITDALNYDDLIRANNDLVRPPYGDEDTGNDIGINGQSYVNGVRMWRLGSQNVTDFFREIFDSNVVQSILDGTKLFGSNAINSILGLSYYPFNIDDVATVDGSSHNITIGSWTTSVATGNYVRNNNKLIDCGSFYVGRVYNDYRDFQMKLFVQLPYCGQHQLSIERYIDRTLSVKYAVDLTSGGCTAFIYANMGSGGGLVCMDSFDGFIASQRPIQAIDQTTYLSNVLRAVSDVGGSVAAPLTNKLDVASQGLSGNVGGAISSGIMSTVGTPLDIAKAGFSIYNAKQIINDPPMATRGGFAGCLGFFGNQRVRFIVAQPITHRPANERILIGMPSSTGAKVSHFSGYLKCSAFQIAQGFNGTSAELSEINSMLSSGIYV